VSQEATKAQCGNKAPSSQEPRDHRVQAALATFSQIHGHDPKASNFGKWKEEKEKSET